MNLTIRSAATALALALAACGSGDDSPAVAASPAASRMALAGAVAAAPAGRARKVEEKEEFYELTFSYPAQADAIPRLKAALEAEIARSRTTLAADAREAQADAVKNDYPYRAHSLQEEWSVVTDLPGWLSLSSVIYSYGGGAHGMTVFDSLLWDRRAGRRRTPIDLFISPAAFRAAATKPMCTALDRERMRRRGGELGASDYGFNKCIDPIESATIILGSSDWRRFDRIGFLIPPYNAGPYAEGPYELTLPVTPALLKAVRPEYRAVFAAR